MGGAKAAAYCCVLLRILDILEGRFVRAIRQDRKYPLERNEVKAYSTDIAALLDVVIIRWSSFMSHRGACQRCSFHRRSLLALAIAVSQVRRTITHEQSELDQFFHDIHYAVVIRGGFHAAVVIELLIGHCHR